MREISKELDTFETMFRTIKTERDDHEEKCNNLTEELELLQRELRALKRQKSTLLFRKTMAAQKLKKQKELARIAHEKKMEEMRMKALEEKKKEEERAKIRELERLEKEKSNELEYLIETHLPFDKASPE